MRAAFEPNPIISVILYSELTMLPLFLMKAAPGYLSCDIIPVMAAWFPITFAALKGGVTASLLSVRANGLSEFNCTTYF